MEQLEKAIGKRVLIIEDEQFISDLYKRSLEKAGFTVNVCADGKEGLAEAQAGNYDIILLDIMLPNMNGIDMLHALKQPQDGQPISSKIVITTNLDQDEKVKNQIEQIADGYLIKAELTPKQLVKFVGELI